MALCRESREKNQFESWTAKCVLAQNICFRKKTPNVTASIFHKPKLSWTKEICGCVPDCCLGTWLMNSFRGWVLCILLVFLSCFIAWYTLEVLWRGQYLHRQWHSSGVSLSALSFGVQSRCQGTGVTFKGVCGFVQDQQHVRGVRVAEIWLSKRGPEEGWDGTLFICCGAAARGLLGCTGSAAALIHENWHNEQIVFWIFSSSL